MPTQSKWESLPTEAINPVSLAIDKAPVSEIVDMAINEDRKIIAAVQKEKERIAHGVEIITHALRKGGRIIFIGAGTSGRLGVVEASEMPPTFGTSPKHRPGDHGRRTGSGVPRQGRRRGQLRGGRAQHQPAAPDAARRRHRRLGERHDAVRARRPDARAQGRRQDHLHHLLAGLRAAELRRPADRARGRARAHRRIDAPQGRHRDQDGPQHADDDRDDQGRQDLRQSDGRRPDRIREAEGSRAPHHRHR